MNPVMLFCYNLTPEQLALSKETLASVFEQDIPVTIYAIDNGSAPETWEWMTEVARNHDNFRCYRNPQNIPPVIVANFWLKQLFLQYKHVLAIPNDVILSKSLYREFLKWPRGIVTGSMTDDRSYDINQPYTPAAISENTPLALVLYRKWAYDALIVKDGYFFDERFTHYCSDCDWALRTASCGIRGIQLNVPYWHYNSASHRLAPPEVGDTMRRGANVDRQRFFEKWGFGVTDLEYGQRALDINFQGKS
jgi:GT2 family glycosyltransferase